MIPRLFFVSASVAASLWAAPPLTTIQDVLYKADGTRFNGSLTISWTSFEAIDRSVIAQQTTTVNVANGSLQVQFVPTTTATPAAFYTVVYHSDGRIQFQETWAVPSSTQPLRVRDVRIATPRCRRRRYRRHQRAGIRHYRTDQRSRRAPLEGSRVFSRPSRLRQSLRCHGNRQRLTHRLRARRWLLRPLRRHTSPTSPTMIRPPASSMAPIPHSPHRRAQSALQPHHLSQWHAAESKPGFFTLRQPHHVPLHAAAARRHARSPATASTGGNDTTPQLYPNPQVLCSGLGAATSSSTLACLGTCTIPAGFLAPGDRVEIRFDLEHQGAAGRLTFEVDWGATTVLSRNALPVDALATGRANLALTAQGAQLSHQSWGTSLAFAAGVGKATDDYNAGLTIDFRAKSAQSGNRDAQKLQRRPYAVTGHGAAPRRPHFP